MAKAYHLATIAAVALAIPRKGKPELTWTESQTVDGRSSRWFSAEETFQIEESVKKVTNPFELKVSDYGREILRAGTFPFPGRGQRGGGTAERPCPARQNSSLPTDVTQPISALEIAFGLWLAARRWVE